MRTSKLGLATILLGVTVILSACSSGVGDPDADRSETMSLSPASDLVYRCITDKGWDVTLTWDGGIESDSSSIPGAQVSQYDADSAECWSKIDNAVAAMQPGEISDVYQNELATRECLIKQGIEVDEAPSEQEYIDTFQTYRWSAYAASDAIGTSSNEDDWRKINETCPQPAWSLGVS